MLGQPMSRGQKQRIKRKIAKLESPDKQERPETKEQEEGLRIRDQALASNPNLVVSSNEKKEKPDTKAGAKQKIEQIMRKRDKKLEAKAAAAERKQSSYLTEEDKQIQTQIKNKKRENRR